MLLLLMPPLPLPLPLAPAPPGGASMPVCPAPRAPRPHCPCRLDPALPPTFDLATPLTPISPPRRRSMARRQRRRSFRVRVHACVSVFLRERSVGKRRVLGCAGDESIPAPSTVATRRRVEALPAAEGEGEEGAAGVVQAEGGRGRREEEEEEEDEVRAFWEDAANQGGWPGGSACSSPGAATRFPQALLRLWVACRSQRRHRPRASARSRRSSPRQAPRRLQRRRRRQSSTRRSPRRPRRPYQTIRCFG